MRQLNSCSYYIERVDNMESRRMLSKDLGSDSRQTTCGLRPKTTTTQFSSTATQPNVINQADTARNKEKPLNSVPVVELQSMRWLPRERRMEEEAPSWTLGTAYTCQLCGQVFLLLVPWQPLQWLATFYISVPFPIRPSWVWTCFVTT